MTLRFVQVFIAEKAAVDLDELLEGLEVVASWQHALGDEGVVLYMIVDVEQVQDVLDRLDDTWDDHVYHAILSSIEAVLPRPRPPDDGDNAGQQADRAAKKAVGRSGSIGREELLDDLADASEMSRVYVALCVLSAVVAAVGLVRDDNAVILGAMVIAPLLGPNIAMALATTLGDISLLRRAATVNAVGLFLVLLASIAFGVVYPVDPDVDAIYKRTEFSFYDLTVGLAAGAAGTFAFTRGQSSAVIGVMAAVALVPPLVVFGILIGDGHFYRSLGAFLLVLANLVCINLAGVATFFAQGVRPRTWWEGRRGKKATRAATALWIVLFLALVVLLVLRVARNAEFP